MSWSYSGSPGDSSRDELRFVVGDTDSTSPIFSDSEIDYIVAKYTVEGTLNVFPAAIYTVRRIVAKYSKLRDEKVGDVKVDWSQKVDNYRELLNQMIDEQTVTGLSSIYAGGISIADKYAVANNANRVAPAFTKDFGRNKRLGSTPVGFDTL